MSTPRDDAPPPLVVGFDLDLTLIDTAPGFRALLGVLGEELGVDFNLDAMTARLGPPLDMMLAPYLPAEQIPAAGDRFRALYPDHAVTSVPLLPGAVESVQAVRDVGGRVLVVTGKHTPNAQLHLDHTGLVVDHLEGRVWGVGKAESLRREGASLYVGDHVHDVEGALAAGVTSLSVLTGGCSRAELEDAGTHVVLESLAEFPDWFDDWFADWRTAPAEGPRSA
ncbi:HAD family hydrolase [Nocardioides sp. zg-ZUI104]|uniref:HAD family hydrolase n=1 Tax=Nocardioides faecalis TaxID=2803858 RepID=UPI001BCCE220|nr:HAD hydrolase-like protein [Nocardioides faecalis]MBS4753174.1 HAD family hydrolase [Nocardioides faecalis]